MTHILLIEDSATDAHAYGRVLRSNGYQVLNASSGEEGMQLAEEHHPDVIIMDIVMPGLNGFQATRELARNDETASIPVIMMSTKDQETDRIWGLRQGAFDYLVKPVKKSMLLQAVEAALAGNALQVPSTS